MTPGQKVKVRGRRGVFVVAHMIPGGVQVRDSDHRLHSFRDSQVKEVRK